MSALPPAAAGGPPAVAAAMREWLTRGIAALEALEPLPHRLAMIRMLREQLARYEAPESFFADKLLEPRTASDWLDRRCGIEASAARAGISSEILYALIGVEARLTRQAILERFAEAQIPSRAARIMFDLMLWYGLLGLSVADDESRYIYDYDYNMKRLRAEIGQRRSSALYVVNPALHAGLAS